MLLAAAASDVRRRRIPNLLSGALALAGLGAQAGSRGWGGVAAGAAGGALALAVLWWPWLEGRLGGGDVKLAAAAATWLGPALLPQLALLTAVAGGVLALPCYWLSSRQTRQEIAANLACAASLLALPDVPGRAAPGRVSVPYGAAAALGALVLLWGARLW